MRWPTLAIAVLACASPLPAQQNTTRAVSLEAADAVPHLVRGTLTQRALNGSLASAMEDIGRHADAPIWAGYAVPAAMFQRDFICCSEQSECFLEGGGTRYFNSNTGNIRQTALDLFVFVRFERGQVTGVRSVSSDCPIDAAGTSIHWLTGVSSGESVAYLLSFALDDSRRSFSTAAIAAIALHADPAADLALEKLVSVGQPRTAREQAAFWIASKSSSQGIDILRRLAREDMDESFRRYLTFPLSIESGDAGVRELIRMAHQDAAPSVRGQALFWMAQKAGAKMAAEIAVSLENDPDTEVKKRAVFALSQLPNGEGIAKLIEVARTNSNPAVRKQAVFWLGQSRDTRALNFLEDVLTH